MLVFYKAVRSGRSKRFFSSRPPAPPAFTPSPIVGAFYPAPGAKTNRLLIVPPPLIPESAAFKVGAIRSLQFGV